MPETTIDKVKKAIENGDIEIVELFLHEGGYAGYQDMNGVSLVHLASEHGRLSIVDLLLVNGANSNVRNRKKWTPLHYAETLGVVKSLVTHGADIHATNSDGETPLHRACGAGMVEIVQYLVEKGASIEPAPAFSPLHNACFTENILLAEFLIDCGAPVNGKDKDGQTPVHLAVLAESLQMIELLYSHQASLDTPNDAGVTPLQLAKERNLEEIITFLENPVLSVKPFENISLQNSQSNILKDPLFEMEDEVPPHQSKSLGDSDSLINENDLKQSANLPPASPLNVDRPNYAIILPPETNKEPTIRWRCFFCTSR